MDEAWKKARREELWNDVVLVHAREAGIDTSLPREKVAVDLLVFQRDKILNSRKNLAEDDIERSHKIASELAFSRIVWQLLNNELYGWLSQYDVIEDIYYKSDGTADAQAIARLVMDMQLAAGGPLHRDGVDPVPIMFPRWLAQSINDGFAALARGETQAIFRSPMAGQHKQAFTWEKMRLRAVQHVAFLRGRGSTKKSALDRVELATNIKAGTLRDWETELKKQAPDKMQIDWAFKAGEISVILEHNPNYANSDGNTLDGYAYSVLIELQREPLGAFGQNYREHAFDTRQI